MVLILCESETIDFGDFGQTGITRDASPEFQKGADVLLRWSSSFSFYLSTASSA